MNKEKTILFVMPRFPFPASSGRKTSLYHYCRLLSEDLGYRLIVAAFSENGDNVKKKPPFIDELVVLPKASTLSRIVHVVIHSIILRKWPMQVSLYWSLKAKIIIDGLVKHEKPDYIIGDMIRSTEYIKNVNGYRIADLDDRLSLRYCRQLNVGIEGLNPYGAFLNNIPVFLQKIMLFAPLKLWVIKNEIELLQNYELEIGKKCDKTIFVAEKEAQEFNRELGEDKAIAVPIGVDVEYFTYQYQKMKNKANIIGFLGAMDVAHNDSAVRFFVMNIFPKILSSVPDAEFWVVGGGAFEELLKLESSHVKFVGRVDDVRTYLGQCKVFVCPMLFGSGIKTKNLEAMAMGIPVVTTSIGAENIGAMNGVEWVVEDDVEKFATAVVSLLTNTMLCEMIGKNGNSFVEKNFTWRRAAEEFKKILEYSKQEDDI